MPDLFDLVGGEAPVFDEVDEQGLGGSVEDAIDEIADHGGDHLTFGLGGAVDVGAIDLLAIEVAFMFQDLHHGHDGGVGDFAAFEEGLVDVADGSGLAFPDDLHDFEFLIGEGFAWRPHTK